jgi:hypothetical protein
VAPTCLSLQESPALFSPGFLTPPSFATGRKDARFKVSGGVLTLRLTDAADSGMPPSSRFSLLGPPSASGGVGSSLVRLPIQVFART